MTFDEFQKARAACLEAQDFFGARAREQQYLIANPGDVRALWMRAWTSKAQGRPGEGAMFDSLAQEAFRNQQRVLRAKIATRNAALLREIGLGEGAPALTPKLIAQHIIDETWGWAQFHPVQYQSGEIAEVPGFGRYKITDPKTVLEKRLSRGMPWEAPLTTFLIDCARRLAPGALVLDVGANIGCSAIPLALHHQGPLIAFEPLPRNYMNLSENVALNPVDHLQLRAEAVGAAPGRVRMADGPPDNPGMAHVARGKEAGVEVEMVSVDDVRASAEAPVGLIKIDVEGHELAVLQGARTVMARDKPVIVAELLGGADSDAARALLAEAGYIGQRLSRSDHVFYPAPA